MGKIIVLNVLLFLTVSVPLSSAATHSLQYFYTGVTPGINFPEFTAVGQVDGGQFMYYDSKERKAVPKTDWIKKVVGDDAEYWDTQTQSLLGAQEVFKVGVQTVMQRFNQTKGIHTVQVMYGCELNDEDGTKRGYEQNGYDGEDFLSLDLKTGTWTAPVPQAVPTKQKWESGIDSMFKVAYLENECIKWLQKYVDYGKSVLERKVRPEVDLFSSDSSSPVVCHATGFFPKAVMISWQKNGEELNEDVELRETLPNQDGTFQKRSILTLSPEELKNNQYTCVVQHSSLEKELVLKVSERRVLPVGGSLGVIVGVVVVVLLLVNIACVVGVVIWKKKSDFRPVPDSKTVLDCKSYPGFKTDSLSSNSYIKTVPPDCKTVPDCKSYPRFKTDSLSSNSSSDSEQSTTSSSAELLPEQSSDEAPH